MHAAGCSMHALCTGRTVNDVVFLHMLQVQFSQIFCMASLKVVFLSIFAQLHIARMLQAAACVH